MVYLNLLKAGIFKSISTRIELPDGTKTFGKTINNQPEKFFTEDVMRQLDEFAQKEFKYGNHQEVEVEEEDAVQNLNENYIRVYDDVIPQLMCQHMIEEFEKNEDQFDKQTLKGHRSFTQITLQQYANWKPYQDNLQYVSIPVSIGTWKIVM